MAQGKAAVRSGVISRVPGAPGVVDTAAIRAAIKGTKIRIVMLPFAPLATKAREAAGTRPQRHAPATLGSHAPRATAPADHGRFRYPVNAARWSPAQSA